MFSRQEYWSRLPFPSPGIFPTQELNPVLLHCRQILYWLSYKGSPLVNANYRVLICCTCHFQSGSLFFVYFGFLCLQVSSVSNFRPDTRGRKLSLIKSHLFSCVVGRQEHCKQYHWHLLWVLRVYGPHWVRGMCFLSLHCSGSMFFCRVTIQSRPCVSCTSQV